MANEFIGAQNYLVLGDEATWGTFPATPTYNHVPVTEYSVRAAPQNRQANPHVGIFQRRHNTNFKLAYQGNLNCPLFGQKFGGMAVSAAQYLLDWAFANPNSAELQSKFAEWAEGPNIANKRHLGLRVNQATLTGSEDSGQIDLSLGLMGKDEIGQSVVTTAQTLPNDRSKLTTFEFADATFALGGTAIQIQSFQLQIANNLKMKYLNSTKPTLLLRTQRVVTLQMVPVKNSDTYETLNRTMGGNEMTGQLVLKGLHNGTGAAATSWTRATIDFPRLSLVNADSQGGIEDILMQPLNFVALKPDTSSNDVGFTWAEVA